MAINNNLKMEALEIEEELIDAIKENAPWGLNYKEAADALGMEYNRFHSVATELIFLGRIKGQRSSRGVRLILSDWDEPDIYAISERQKKVLEYLVSIADENGRVRVSVSKIAQVTGSGYDTVSRLDYKGYLEVIERGWASQAALYQIYPARDGPRGYSYIPSKSYTPKIEKAHREIVRARLEQLRAEFPWVEFDESCERTDPRELRAFADHLGMIARNEERENG